MKRPFFVMGIQAFLNEPRGRDEIIFLHPSRVSSDNALPGAYHGSPTPGLSAAAYSTQTIHPQYAVHFFYPDFPSAHLQTGFWDVSQKLEQSLHAVAHHRITVVDSDGRDGIIPPAPGNILLAAGHHFYLTRRLS